MRFLKLKGILNILSCAGMRVLVVAAAMMGTVMVAYSSYSLYEQMYTQSRAFDSGIRKFDNEQELQEAQKSLQEERANYRAWLRVDGTHIDYPVVQGPDDVYYATHDIDDKSNLTGAIYMAADNTSDLSDNYIMVYGHHMDNGAMFGDLDLFTEASFLDAHREAALVCPAGMYEVELFAVLKTDAYDETVYTVGDRNLAEVFAYLDSKAAIVREVDRPGVKKMLVLSTCESAITNGRLLVFGVMEAAATEPVEPSVSPVVTPEITGGAQIITPAPDKPGEGPDAPKTGENRSAIGRFFNRFLPGGSSYGFDAWALVNLVCLLVTLYILLPVNRLRGKFGRIDRMRRVNLAKAALWNEEGLSAAQKAERERILELARSRKGGGDTKITKKEYYEAVERRYYRVGRFAGRFTAGIILEAIVAAFAFAAYVATENMRLPMVLIDQWTPLMLMLTVTCWVIDMALLRYREGDGESEKAED